MDAAELYWAYKVLREREDEQYQGQYEVARFLGILIKNPKLLPRLREVLPFFWEIGKKAIRQSVSDMKKAVIALAGVQGISKKPLPKVLNLRIAAKKKAEKLKKEREPK